MSFEKLCSQGHVIGDNESVCARDGGLPVNLPEPAIDESEKEEIVEDKIEEPIIEAKALKVKKVVAKKAVTPKKKKK